MSLVGMHVALNTDGNSQLHKQLNLKLVTLQPCDYIPMYRSKGNENMCPHKTCTRMCVAALFVQPKRGNNSTSLLMNEWSEMGHIQTTERHSALPWEGLGTPTF